MIFLPDCSERIPIGKVLGSYQFVIVRRRPKQQMLSELTLTLKQSLRRQMTLDVSPPLAAGPLNRTLFRKSIPILAARFPGTKLGSVRKSVPMRRYQPL
jgi:hypothetical protein